jgi:hypothetical protein
MDHGEMLVTPHSVPAGTAGDASGDRKEEVKEMFHVNPAQQDFASAEIDAE